MASYFTGEIVGVKRKAPEVITMVNGYPHATYPAFDIVGKLLWRNLPKDKYEVKVNNSNCILRVSDCDIFKIDYAEESEIFDSILLNDTLSQPYIYLGEFADHVLNKKRKAFGFSGGFTQLSKKELKYAEADEKAAKEVYVYNYRYDPKYLERSLKNLQQNSLYGMYPEYFPGYHFTPVRRPLKALEELNKREFERVAAEPIRFNIDEFKLPTKEEIKKMINKEFGVSGTYTWNLYKKIIFNGPCTIILWTDGSKTIAKTSSDEEVFDPEKGVAICFMKKMLGHTETNKILRKASEQYEEYIAENRPNGSFDEFIDFCKNYFKSETKPVDHIDQSAIEEVKKLEEDQDE